MELKDFIQNNFSSSKDAFEYFIKHGLSQTTITYEVFAKGLHNQLPGSFKEENIRKIWDRLVPGNAKVITKVMFVKKLFGHEEFRGSLKLTSAQSTEKKSFRSRILPRNTIDARNLRSSKSKISTIEPNLEDVFSKLKRYAKTSANSQEEAFRKVDTQNRGVMTNLEFKEVIRSLNIGFSIHDRVGV